MKTILDILTKKMEWKVKNQIFRRYDALVRQYEYLLKNHNKDLIFTLDNGWFDNKYRCLFALNSFFQIVIGPLASSTIGRSKTGIGSLIPIVYGKSMRFDYHWNNEIRTVYSDYIDLINELGFDEWWLNANQASDAIYNIAKRIQEDEME